MNNNVNGKYTIKGIKNGKTQLLCEVDNHIFAYGLWEFLTTKSYGTDNGFFKVCKLHSLNSDVVDDDMTTLIEKINKMPSWSETYNGEVTLESRKINSQHGYGFTIALEYKVIPQSWSNRVNAISIHHENSNTWDFSHKPWSLVKLERHGYPFSISLDDYDEISIGYEVSFSFDNQEFSEVSWIYDDSETDEDSKVFHGFYKDIEYTAESLKLIPLDMELADVNYWSSVEETTSDYGNIQIEYVKYDNDPPPQDTETIKVGLKVILNNQYNPDDSSRSGPVFTNGFLLKTNLGVLKVKTTPTEVSTLPLRRVELVCSFDMVFRRNSRD